MCEDQEFNLRAEMTSENVKKTLFPGVFIDTDESVLDKLPDEKRETVERATVHILVHLAKHLSNYAFYIIRKLEDRGIKVNLNYDLRKFKRSVAITIMFDLRDVSPSTILQYYKYFFKKTGTDRWAKWAFFKAMKELSGEIMSEAVDEMLESGEEASEEKRDESVES